MPVLLSRIKKRFAQLEETMFEKNDIINHFAIAKKKLFWTEFSYCERDSYQYNTGGDLSCAIISQVAITFYLQQAELRAVCRSSNQLLNVFLCSIRCYYIHCGN